MSGGQSGIVPEVVEFLSMPIPDEIMSQVAGNASHEVKEIPIKWLAFFRRRGNSFCCPISRRLRVTEVSINPNQEDANRVEARVVCEIDVEEDMLNGTRNLHEGCIAYLVDECTVVAVSTVKAAEGRMSHPGVSQAINIVYHAPAPLGAKLRIISSSLTSGGAMTTSRNELWDMTNHRLIASGMQLQMRPRAHL